MCEHLGGGVILESPRHGTEAEEDDDDDMNGILWKDLCFDNFQQHSEFPNMSETPTFSKAFLGFL